MDSGFNHTKMDPGFSILSQRQIPSLLTSVSQVMTPTRVPHIYSSSRHTYPILNHLAQSGSSMPKYSVVENDTKYMPGEKKSNHEAIEREIFSESHLRLEHGPIDIEDNMKKALDATDRNNSEDKEFSLETLERQIIKDTSCHTDMINSQNYTGTVSYFPTQLQTRNPVYSDITAVDLSRNTVSQTPIYTLCRSHSSTLSSNTDTNQYTSLSTRCSDCDGCSSSESGIHSLHVNLPACTTYHQIPGWSDRSRNCSEGSTFSAEVDSYMYKHTRDDTCVGLMLPNMDLDVSNVRHSNKSPDVSLHNHDICGRDMIGPKGPHCRLNHYQGHGQNTLGHVIVLATWIQLSKIKELQNENVKQRQTMIECKKKVDSLILTVLVLSRQMKSSVSRLQSSNAHLDQIKETQKQYEHKLKRLQFGFACLAVLYVLQLSSFRNSCLSLIRFFGILELISKINRTRKMISKNWRNIPSLLTDFWRIFIFRSRSRLSDRFT